MMWEEQLTSFVASVGDDVLRLRVTPRFIDHNLTYGWEVCNASLQRISEGVADDVDSAKAAAHDAAIHILKDALEEIA